MEIKINKEIRNYTEYRVARAAKIWYNDSDRDRLDIHAFFTRRLIMNNELEKFVDMAFKRELYQVVSIDATRSNRIHDKALKLMAKMDAENRRGELKELFRHPDPFVRLAAASWVLEVDEDAAMAVLRKLAKIKRGDVGFDAKFKIVCWYEQAHGISLDISKIGEEDF